MSKASAASGLIGQSRPKAKTHELVINPVVYAERRGSNNATAMPISAAE